MENQKPLASSESFSNNLNPPLDVEKKLHNQLVDYVYKQGPMGMISSLICATIIFIGVYGLIEKALLFSWYSAFIIVTCARYILVKCYEARTQKNNDSSLLWRNLFAVGACLVGICWGVVGVFFLLEANGMVNILIILVIAGVTAGAVPLFSGILYSSIAFLIPTILPFAIHFLLTGKSYLLLLGSSMVLYLIYLIFLSKRLHQLIVKTIGLQFDNDALVHSLSEAKNLLESVNKELSIAATHDALTHLPNRTLFGYIISEAINRANRNQKLIGIFYLDLDYFKKANDTHGHAVGDELLRSATARIQSIMRTNDIIARLGGDEFAIIFEDISDPRHLIAKAELICMELKQPFVINKVTLNISVSIGISIYPLDGLNAEALLKKADAAMYMVKNTTRNGFHFSNDPTLQG